MDESDDGPPIAERSPSEDAQTIYRTKRRGGFAQIPNDALRDERLSFRARGLLAYMLSFPDDWQHRADDLPGHGREGREAVRTALRELEALGYRTRERRRDGRGRIRTYVTLTDTAADAQEPVGPLGGTSVDRASLEHGHEHGHEYEEPSSSLSLLGDDDPAAANGEATANVSAVETGSRASAAGQDPPAAAAARKPKARKNPVWDALAAVYGAPATAGERAHFGKVCRELGEVEGVTGEEVERRARRAKAQWPGSTIASVSKHWTLLGEVRPDPAMANDVPEYDRSVPSGRTSM